MADAARHAALEEAVLSESDPVWTTARVLALYRARGVAVRQRSTARHDLQSLAARGLLTRDDTGHDRRWHTRKEDA
jgi:hypothetical protein